MKRSRIIGGLALASMMLVVLTGCPSVIQNVVGTSESVQQAVNNADAGDTIKVQGSHSEDVTIDKDNVKITGENGAEIDGDTEVNGDNVAIENITITGKLKTTPGSFNNLSLSNVTVQGWNGAIVSGTFSCTRVVQPNGDLQDTVENQANAGDNVCVAPDTYTVSSAPLQIDQPLTLRGFNQPTIQADLSSLGNFGPAIENRQPVIWVDDADNVAIDSFVIRDSAPNTNPPDAPRGILLTVNSQSSGSSDNFTLHNSVIEDLISGNLRARGVAFNVQEDVQQGGFEKTQPSVETAHNPTFTNNTFRNITGQGNSGDIVGAIHLNGDIQGASITNNSIIDLTSNGSCAQGIVFTEDGATTPVGPSGFTIKGNTFTNLEGSSACWGVPRVHVHAFFIGGYADFGNHEVTDNNFDLNNKQSDAVRLGVTRFPVSSESDVLDAEGNFWGASSGPGDPNEPLGEPGGEESKDLEGDPSNCGDPAKESNPNGDGAGVLDFSDKGDNRGPVDYCPWSTSAN